VPVLRVRRYRCRDCGADVISKFLFDGLIFDADYFRQKMAESRKRKQEQREQVRRILAESRSGDLPMGQADLGNVPGLVDALNALTTGMDESLAIETGDEFNLKAYESHVRDHVRDLPLSLAEIPLLCENPRKDLIWRFIAVIFLAHIGVVDVWQEGRDIMVKKHEANRERQDVLGESEGVDRVEGLVG
jgi:hypothetical protein